MKTGFLVAKTGLACARCGPTVHTFKQHGIHLLAQSRYVIHKFYMPFIAQLYSIAFDNLPTVFHIETTTLEGCDDFRTRDVFGVIGIIQNPGKHYCVKCIHRLSPVELAFLLAPA